MIYSRRQKSSHLPSVLRERAIPFNSRLINEELGRHRGREGKTECSLCENECENVSHVLRECSAYIVHPESF